MAYEPLQLNLGSLRSAMSLKLHTHHASRIWHGRAPTEGRPGIIGLNGFIGAMNKMKRGAEQDDPYSDWWMLRIEDKLADTKTRLQTLREQVDQALADVPPALSLGENMNVQPVKLPLFVNAQLGFMAVYLLADYDDLARKLILAHHTALIDRSTLERWLNDGAHALRSLFSADPGVDLLVADLSRPQGHPRILALQASVARFACLFRARAGGSPHRPDEAEKERRRVPCGRT
jgi:integrating conjugative element protein (TIGR03761 family)